MIGVRISTLRRHAGMSQTELAEKLKISASAVGMYEQGRREPSLETLVDIGKLFDVSLDFLVTGKAVGQKDKEKLEGMLQERIQVTDHRLDNRRVRPFSRQELAVLFAAMLMEP